MTAKRLPSGKVQLTSGDLVANFDPNYGGAPLEWAYKGIPLIDSFPGVGVQSTWEYGQDSTQASANGPLPNPICQINGNGVGYAYYGAEIAYSSVGLYAVRQFCPAFWLSHEAPDDSIPPECIGEWRTKYLTPTFIPDWSIGSTPVFWQGNPTKLAGTFWVGNEMLGDMSVSWANRLCEFKEGNVAAKVRISLKNADAGAYAGIMFKKAVPLNASEDLAYISAGYHFLFNKQGHWALHEFPSGNILIQGQLPSASLSRLITGIGAMMEIRTQPAYPGSTQLYCDGVELADLFVGHEGPHFGLLGSCSTGFISFGERQIFDLNFRLTSTARTTPTGISLEYRLDQNHATQDPLIHKLYRANLGLFFFNEQTFEDGWCEAGEIVNPGIVTFVSNPPPYKAVAPKHNLQFVIDAKIPLPSQGHALVGGTVIHFNMLSQNANIDPVMVYSTGVRLDITVGDYHAAT